MLLRPCRTGANKWKIPVAADTTAERVLPALSRRHEAGAGSARGMLFTLLGEFVLPGEGEGGDEGGAWTSAVLAVFGRLGVAEKATRQALMRTANAGWLTAQKSGRRTRWQLTPAATP